MRKWRIEDSEELYNIGGWGVSYFGINEKGHVYVTPRKDGVEVDLKELVDDLAMRDLSTPLLVRFPDILDNRIEKTDDCFKRAAKQYKFQAEHFIIFPIKVNQMRPVVEEIISHGKNIIWDLKPVPNRSFMLFWRPTWTATVSSFATGIKIRIS